MPGVINDAARRAGDLASRYGGEEFILILPGASPRQALDRAEELRLSLEQAALPHCSSPVRPTLTLSLGVSGMIPDETNRPEILITLADEALYQAKMEGRDRSICSAGGH